MLDTQTRPAPRTATSATVNADRRTRRRLRELCEEVLASYRVASDRDLFTADDRDAGRNLIRHVVRK